MDLEQQAQAEEISLVAIGLDPAEREAYLRRRMADSEILAEVRRRLELAARIPEEFLDRPAVELVSGGEPAADGPSAGQAESGAAVEQLSFPEGRRYRLDGVLGAGGMAVVFRAFDQRLERSVAIKHLRHALAEDPRALKRFEREARAIAHVSHPAVVQIFDILRDRDDLWIVMELVSGRPLASLLTEGRLELGEALVLAADVADGLAAAHERGIVHRDLKAANAMVTPDGRGSPARAKILDFGLARPIFSDDGLSADSGLRGTPAAMSPEQVSRSPVDARSDLFSFGTLLYQMVTGISPFAGPSPLVTLDRVCRLRSPPARRIEPRVPEELSALIERLLEKDPSRRPRDTVAVARTLARLAESAAGTAAPRSHRREPPGDAAQAAIPSAAAERRQVTILHCQLGAGHGSGRLLEPEELLEIEGSFRDAAAPILERHGGHLGEWHDGGLRAYFGFPRAREGDPERGVAAALELTAAVEGEIGASWGDPAGLRLRAGVHSGPVVVTTSPDGRRQVVLGRTGCCAAEMRTSSESGAVLVSAETHGLARGRFRFQPLGVCSLVLCRRPTEIFRVLAARPAGGESDEAELTPFLGREAELGLLGHLRRQVEEDGGRVVLVNGGAGSGKSRLVRAFRGAAEPGPWHQVFCRGAAAPGIFARLFHSLGIEGEMEPGALLRRLVEGTAGGAATVLAIEDVHLADSADLELLGRLIDQAPAVPLLILLTCRPPFAAPWKLPADSTVLSLGPLDAGEVRQMIRHLTAGRALPPGAEERILAAADGVPRFVEELTRTMLRLEEQAAAQTAAGEPVGPPPALVPAALSSWLTARLDRLDNAREVARVASVLGREFTREQLLALIPAAGDRLEQALERLVEAEFLGRRGSGWRSIYRFRLALDREAAYESLIAAHRRLYEERAAAFAGVDERSRVEPGSGSAAPSVSRP